jgi:hypothetical protein
MSGKDKTILSNHYMKGKWAILEKYVKYFTISDLSKGDIHAFGYKLKKENCEIHALIEFDENNPEYGIYYGCRVTNKKDVPIKSIEKMKYLPSLGQCLILIILI